MRVANWTVYRVRIPLKTKIAHASHVRSSTDSIVVRCQLQDGAVGWGEGLPREYVTGETIDQAWDLIRVLPWPDIAGAGWKNIRELVQDLSSHTWAPLATDERGCFGNSVRCAIELSLLDAVCRQEGRPLSDVTSCLPETEPFRTSLDRVAYSAAFTGSSAWKTAVRALLYRANGFAQAKVKVGMAGGDDARLLRRIRRLVGAAMDLRLDANEAWTCDELARKATPLLPYRITSLEQPVPHEQVQGLARLRGQIGVPLMLDESLCSPRDAERAIEQGTCDLFNLRLSKCGGFVSSLQLAAMAHRAGLQCQLGCQVGETGILSAAGRHFATSVRGLRYLEGSYDRYLVRERLTVEDLTWGYAGQAPALTKPGLGIEIDTQALDRVKLDEMTFC